jgi:hypothetical protein
MAAWLQARKKTALALGRLHRMVAKARTMGKAHEAPRIGPQPGC